ncbi:MAG TPA: hypothetical protein VFV95_13350 [Vicinamibacterales bacterium]|nr:hypothetical protein [Vicinamibacterales bacterium]
MKLTGIALLTSLLLAAALPAAAQSPVSIRFDNGNVTLTANNAPLRTILAEWTRVGGSKIVNAERVTGQPVTLELNNVPEREALRVLLRSLGGYMAAARRDGATGASTLDRIFLIPTPAPPNTPATNAVNTPSPAAPRPGATQTINQTPSPLFFPGDADDGVDEIVLPNGQRRVITNSTNTQQLVREAAAAAAAARANQAAVDEDEGPQPQPQAPATTPGMPGGVIRGTSRPGEITPVPPQQRNRPNDEP